MDPESQAGSTLRRTNTTSPATGSKQQRAIAKPRVEKRRSVQRKGITNRAWKARLATRSGMKRKPAWRKLPERNAQLKTQQQGSVKPGWAHAPVCEPRQPGKLIYCCWCYCCRCASVVSLIVVVVVVLVSVSQQFCCCSRCSPCSRPSRRSRLCCSCSSDFFPVAVLIVFVMFLLSVLVCLRQTPVATNTGQNC